MRNPALVRDHLARASARLRALDTLFAAESWADVVRESQEVVELALKALLRASDVDPPRVHDVSDVLVAERARLPEGLLGHVDELCTVSRTLRRDRELAFYGAEDLSPSRFYTRGDAEAALRGARRTVELVTANVVTDDG